MTLGIAIAIAATILGSATSTVFARSADERPKYAFLRYDEDWSFLRDLPKDPYSAENRSASTGEVFETPALAERSLSVAISGAEV